MEFITTSQDAQSTDGRLSFNVHRMEPSYGEFDLDLQFIVTVDGDKEGMALQALDLPGTPCIFAVRIRAPTEIEYFSALKKRLNDQRNDIDFLVDVANGFVEMFASGTSIAFDTTILFTIARELLEPDVAGQFSKAPTSVGDDVVLVSQDVKATIHSDMDASL